MLLYDQDTEPEARQAHAGDRLGLVARLADRFAVYPDIAAGPASMQNAGQSCQTMYRASP
jgi:hypothetical protein